MSHHPWAYLLLNLIALRACRALPNPDGLEIGEALIGDWNAIGATRGQYRHALKILQKEKHINISETNRNRQKATTGTTTKGTKVKLLNSVIWDTNPEHNNHCHDHRTTTEQPRRRNEEVKNGISNDIPNKVRPRTAKRPRSVDALSFDHESWSFTGITEKDVADWKLMYPHIDIQVETLKAAQWFKNNQSKSRRSSYRKYLTGWFGRENERIENKKAYRSGAGSIAQDRRTKDIDGNPVDSPHTGRF